MSAQISESAEKTSCKKCSFLNCWETVISTQAAPYANRLPCTSIILFQAAPYSVIQSLYIQRYRVKQLCIICI